MKSTGIVRKVDELGRIVIPKELRGTLGIGTKDALEIFVDGDKIILGKYAPGCNGCGEYVVADKNNTAGKITLCPKCIKHLKA